MSEITLDAPKLEVPEIEDSTLTTAKTVTKFVIGKCVSGVIVTLLHNNVQTHSKSQKVQLYVGAYVVGAMVSDKAAEWTDKQIDDLVEIGRSVKSYFSKNKKSEETEETHTEETPTE